MPETIPTDLLERMTAAGAAAPVQPVDQAPPAIPVPGEPEPAPQPAQPADYTFGGRFKTREDLDAVVQRYDALKDLKDEDIAVAKEATKMKAELDKATAKLEQTRKSHVLNPIYYKLQQVEQQNPELIDIMRKHLLGNTTDEELVKMSFTEKNPSLAKDPEKLNLLYNRKFGILTQPDADTESEDYKYAKLDLQMEAEGLRNRLDGIAKGIEVPTLESIELNEQQALNTLASEWKPVMETALTNKFPLTLPDGTEMGELDISTDDLARYTETISRLLLASGTKPTEASPTEVREAILRQYAGEHWSDIVVAVSNKVSESVGQDWRKLVHNPGTPGQVADPPTGQSPIGDVLNYMSSVGR